MTSIIWGSFGMTLLLVVAVGAMIQYIKDREKYKKTKDEGWNKMVDMISVEQPAAVPEISEPVTSFIKCFKENPRRFKVVGGNLLKDTVTNVSYVFMITYRYGCDGRVLPHFHNTDRRLQWLSDREKDAIVLALYPYFITERRDRLHAIQRQRLTRIYKENHNV